MTNRFLKGTLVLTIAGFVVKAIGSVNWILLSRVLGGEGIGIYQMAFPIYLLALQISSAGIPIAISIVTAEKLAKSDYDGAKRVFNISFIMLCLTGLVCSLAIYFGSPWLIESHWIEEPRSYYSLIALSPAIFFVTLISCFRGYLQGWQLMTPTAVSQIVEQLLRVVVMLSAGYLLLPYGLGIAAGGASMGAGVGAFGALLILIYYYKKLPTATEYEKIKAEYNEVEPVPVSEEIPSEILTEFEEEHKKEEHKKESSASILIRLIKLAIPISMASILLPLVANLDLFIVPKRLLVAGFSQSETTALFGYLTGMAVPLVNLATIFTAALATSLVPSISSLLSNNDSKGIFYRTAGSMRLTFIGTVPFSIMLFILAKPVVTIIYNAPGAAQATEIIAFSIFFLGIHQVSTGILQGLGKPKIPVINMCISAVFKVVLNWTLTAIPYLGIAGASYATVVDIAIAALLNMIFVKKYTGYFLDFSILWKNFVSAGIMGIIMYFLYAFLEIKIHMFFAFLITAIVGSIIYILLMVLTKGFTKDDAKKLPFVKKFVS